jgi:hypothetical protein
MTLTGTFEGETDKAYKIRIDDKNHWLPKKMVDFCTDPLIDGSPATFKMYSKFKLTEYKNTSAYTYCQRCDNKKEYCCCNGGNKKFNQHKKHLFPKK